jgi:CAAX prenyl protease-like protein
MIAGLMRFLRQQFAASPEYPRVVPFAVFVLLTFAQGKFGPASVYWVYLFKSLVGAWLIFEAHPFVPEMRWRLSWEAVLVGIIVCAIWIGLDGLYPRLQESKTVWNPHEEFGINSGAAWFFNLTRLAGSAIVVPPLEEVFYRSFVYRYLVKTNFQTMPLGQFHGLSFVVTCCIFGFMHPDRWLAGILCGVAYQGLVIYKARLGDAITAHCITNFLLGVWVIWKGDWNFW